MKRIVIIGASSGLGRKIAMDFSKAGWKVAIAARREDKLKEIADACTGSVDYMTIDVVADDAEQRLLELIKKNGGMDTLLLASGVGFANPEIDQKLDDNIVRVNVFGFTRIINAAYKYFKEENAERCQIAAITSIAGTKGLGIAAAYSGSKRYQSTYLQAIDQLAHMQGVKLDITDIQPGFVKTDLLDANKHYPLIMDVDYAAKRIERAIVKRKKRVVIDWKWGLITGAWRLIPNWLWRHLPVKNF